MLRLLGVYSGDECFDALSSFYYFHAWQLKIFHNRWTHKIQQNRCQVKVLNEVRTPRAAVKVNCNITGESLIDNRGNLVSFCSHSPHTVRQCPTPGSPSATRRAPCPCGRPRSDSAWATAASSSCPPCCGGRGTPLHRRLHTQDEWSSFPRSVSRYGPTHLVRSHPHLLPHLCQGGERENSVFFPQPVSTFIPPVSSHLNFIKH